MIKAGLLMASLAAASIALQQDFLDHEWESFKEKHGKTYISAEEEARRKLIFEQNLELVIENNKKYTEGNITYKLAMNRFGDLRANLEALSSPAVPLNITDLPEEVDWSKKGAITPFPDQLSCFSSYPHCAESICTFNLTTANASSFGDIGRTREMAIKQILASSGPLCVGVNSRDPTFAFYEAGVYRYTGCSFDRMNHAVTLVGYYDARDDDPQWILKNSWGSNWGEDGYFRLSDDVYDQCSFRSLF